MGRSNWKLKTKTRSIIEFNKINKIWLDLISISQIASYIFRTHKFRFNWNSHFCLSTKPNIFLICLFFIFCLNKKFLTEKIWERPPASPLSQKIWGDKIRKWSIAKSENIFFRNQKQDLLSGWFVSDFQNLLLRRRKTFLLKKFQLFVFVSKKKLSIKLTI